MEERDKQSSAWVTFCLKIFLTGIFKWVKKFKLCNNTLSPPKPIRALAIIVFKPSEIEQVDKSRIPPVISIVPDRIDNTTLW